MWSLTKALTVLPALAALVSPVSALTSSAATATTVTPLTCPYRTVNYITHRLPRQCLASARPVVTSTATDESASPTTDHTTVSVSPSEPLNTSSADSASTSDSVTSEPGVEPTVVSPATDPQDQSTTTASRTETVESPASSPHDGTDEDSPLEDVKFLSFEDWKRENLEKSGQSEHVGKGHGIDGREPRKRTPLVHDSLDTFGDDAEIDIDFAGFVSEGLDPPTQGQARPKQEIPEERGDFESGRAPRAGARSKDAGTTCKERFNYASYDCAASILKTNPEAKGPSAVLGNNKDSYMLNECSARNKFLILELCDDISIDTIVVANFEFFSSTFRTFRVSVSDKYPVKTDKWKTLGTFEARNSREVQAFLVDNPVIWARYLRIEFLTHYGNEYYCPVSLVRVHGTTMMEEYKHDLESLQLDDEDDKEDLEEDDEYEEDGLVPEAIAEELLVKVEAAASSGGTDQMSDLPPIDPAQMPSAPVNTAQVESLDIVATMISTSPPQFSALFSESSYENEITDTCKTVIEETTSSKSEAGQPPTTSPSSTSTSIPDSSDAHTSTASDPVASESSAGDTTATLPGSQTAKLKSEASEDASLSNGSSATSVNSTKPSTTATQPAPPAPTMQESFFKSVQKRLQMLEANSSLSLQYIEEQSRSLRDAFQRVEQRQLAKATNFLEYLNSTVLQELRDFRQQYDQLWQSTVIELEMQREHYQRENMAANARLGVLADELIFQKRMSVLHTVLVLICLGLVLFSKGSLNSYWELPLVQSVLARTPTSRRGPLSSLDTPSSSPAVTRENSTGGLQKRQGILKGHRRVVSVDSIEDGMSPSDLYSPPTPVSFGEPSSDLEEKDYNSRLGDPQYDPSLIERPSTSPPMLSGPETPTFSEVNGDGADGSIDAVFQSSPPVGSGRSLPTLVVEDATPPPKQLKWKLPDS